VRLDYPLLALAAYLFFLASLAAGHSCAWRCSCGG